MRGSGRFCSTYVRKSDYWDLVTDCLSKLMSACADISIFRYFVHQYGSMVVSDGTCHCEIPFVCGPLYRRLVSVKSLHRFCEDVMPLKRKPHTTVRCRRKSTRARVCPDARAFAKKNTLSPRGFVIWWTWMTNGSRCKSSVPYACSTCYGSI